MPFDDTRTITPPGEVASAGAGRRGGFGWFRDLPTAGKLASLVALLGAFLVLVGVVGVAGMGTMNGEAQTLYEHEVKGLEHLDNVKGAMYRSEVAMRQHLAAADPSTLAGFERTLTEQDARVREELAA